jgi:hypothetical protein
MRKFIIGRNSNPEPRSKSSHSPHKVRPKVQTLKRPPPPHPYPPNPSRAVHRQHNTLSSVTHLDAIPTPEVREYSHNVSPHPNSRDMVPPSPRDNLLRNRTGCPIACPELVESVSLLRHGFEPPPTRALNNPTYTNLYHLLLAFYTLQPPKSQQKSCQAPQTKKINLTIGIQTR